MIDNIDKKIKVINEIKCIYCGCTQQNACVDKFGKSCYWVNINYEKKIGICSACFINNIKEK